MSLPTPLFPSSVLSVRGMAEIQGKTFHVDGMKCLGLVAYHVEITTRKSQSEKLHLSDVCRYIVIWRTELNNVCACHQLARGNWG